MCFLILVIYLFNWGSEASRLYIEGLDLMLIIML